MRQFSFLLCLLGLWTNLSAQNTSNLWTAIAWNDISLPDGTEIDFEPKAYQSYELDYNSLRQQLAQAPMEFTAAAKNSPVVVRLPLANGRFERFALVESPVMAPQLQERYPDIRTYSGYSLDNEHQKIRCSTSPDWGFRAIILREDKGAEYIEPLARWQTKYYRVYDRHEFPDELRVNAKATAEFVNNGDPSVKPNLPDPKPLDGSPELAAPVVLKVYRFAAACTGEFSQDNGGTLDAVLAKVVDVSNKLNAIYERDLDIRLELVPNNDQIIFLDPATDPYTGTTVGGWLDQNPLAMVQRLGGADKYDIGHVFAKYLGGGAAGVGTLASCCTQLKGRGCSSGNKPYEDDFFSIIGQEIGHQLNGHHTWTHCNPDPGDSPGVACEPGSGSTIMSYAGTCGPDNVINARGDLYYHVCSILEIRNFIELGAGNTCGTNITTTNNPPVVTIPYPNNFFIPISTPFELSGSAVDPDGDALTYCWEQIDTGPLVPLGSPVGNTPIFRTFPPTTSSTRTFPRIQTIVNNQSNNTEILPTYSRDMSFALTARDSRTGGGGVGIDTLRFKATASAGPFLVTSPSGTFNTWNQGEYQLVTWDVANTDKAPVNCQKVNIKLSVTGGITYTTTLAENVANTGRYCVKVPDNLVSNTARIRVEAADNVFFDISNANFRIQAPTEPGFSLCPASIYDTICLPATHTSVISTSSSLGFSSPITLSASGLPNGVTVTFSPNPVMPGSDATMMISLPANQPENSFDITIKGESGAISSEVVNTISVFFNDFTGMSLKSPADGVAGQDRAPVLKWNTVPDANFYDIQVANNPSFDAGTLVATFQNVVADSAKIQNLLEKGTVYYWRVRGKNECGNGKWVGPFAFSTLVDVCVALEATDLPINITNNGTPTVESKITLPSGGIISDLNVSQIQIRHEYFQDLEVRLISPANTNVLLFKNKCPNSNGTFSFGFDDSKSALFGCPPPKDGSIYKPTEALSAFNNQNASGTWILQVKDNVISSGGTLQAFMLEICSSTALNPPVLVNNNTLQVMPGANAEIPTALLKTEDANNSDDELLYTLVSLPEHGRLELFWTGEMQVGAQFTQTDLNNGGLRYFNYGGNATSDKFCFTVTDGEGGLISDCFNVQPFPVSAKEAESAVDFVLRPNPATETVRLAFGEALRSDTQVRVFDTAGRMLLANTIASGQVMAQLDLANLSEGLYLIVVDNAQGSGVRKLIVR